MPQCPNVKAYGIVGILDRNSSVGIVTGYGLAGLRIESRRCQ